MRVLHVSHSLQAGGAARAASRLDAALNEHHINSLVLTPDGLYRSGKSIERAGSLSRARSQISKVAEIRLASAVLPNDQTHRTLGVLPSGLPKRIRSLQPSVINLHWLGFGTLSVRQIARLSGPVVWTMHDEWPLLASQHYRSTEAPTNAARLEGGMAAFRNQADIDVRRRKLRSWTRPRLIVAPSSWLRQEARKSAITANWPSRVIPNALPTHLFRPMSREVARSALGISDDGPVALFGALGGGSDPRKGWDLLEMALGRLRSGGVQLRVVTFGGVDFRKSIAGFPHLGLGPLADDLSLALAYNAADVMIVPSRLDNLPQTATEAQSCGTPVVAFRAGGMEDAVEHGRTGYLAEAWSIEDLARGVTTVLDARTGSGLRQAARDRAVRLWSEDVIAREYARTYEELIRGYVHGGG